MVDQVGGGNSMKTLKLVLDIASLILSVTTIIFILATWKKTPELVEPEEEFTWEAIQ